MWQIISNISSIITCFLFLVFIFGRIWKISVTNFIKYENFKVIPYSSDINIEEEDDFIKVDDYGDKFYITSQYGIRNIKIFKVSYKINNDGSLTLVSREEKSHYGELNVNDKLYIQCNLGESTPNTQIEIERVDYVKVTFEIVSSGKNGNILINKYHAKTTLKSILYYFFT